MWGLKNKSALVGLIVLCNLILFGNVFSQGFIIPRPIPPFEPAMPKLTEHKVNVEIIEQVSRVKVDQVFYNDSKQPIEGTYYFPLPKEASVSDFKMIVDGKVLSGELLDKDKARQIYEEIVRRNIDPALLEYVDYNLFSAKIFPIPPQKERKIVLEYSLLLKLDGDLVQFTYPLNGRIESERFFPRPPRPYPGPPYLIPLQDGEEKALAKDEKDSKRLTDISQIIFVDLKSKIPLKNIYSPSHEVDISRTDDHHAKISYEGKRRDSEDNFVLYYSLSQKDFGLSLLSYRPEEKENGFFMLLISPKTEIAKDEIINKDIVFILDVSGSMDGEKIKQAKDALQYCIKNLDNDDRFNLISFSTESKLFKKGLVSVSEFRNDAIKYIGELEAKGGTNINEALLDALKMEGNARRPMSLVFITDGLPTVGETNIGNIIDNVAKENKEK
ncbi:MAG TPA: VIT domain-containing protein, partial [bacterium]